MSIHFGHSCMCIFKEHYWKNNDTQWHFDIWLLMPLFFIWWIWMTNGEAYHLLMASHITCGLEMELSTEQNTCRSTMFYSHSYRSAATDKHVFSFVLAALETDDLVWHLQSNLGSNNVIQIQLMWGGQWAWNCRRAHFVSPKLNTWLISLWTGK